LHDARKNIDALGIDAALIQLATHAWFEGGIEGYDRGQSDARGLTGASDGLSPPWGAPRRPPTRSSSL
jgi:hypothetical protein